MKNQIANEPVQQPIPEEPSIELNRQSTNEGHWNPSYLDDEKPSPVVEVIIPSTSKQPAIIVSHPDAVSSTINVVSSNQTAAPEPEKSIEPIYSKVVKPESKPASKPIEGSQIGSSQSVVDSSSNFEISKPEVIEIIIPPTVEVVSSEKQAKTDDGKVQTVSSQTVTSTSGKIESSDSGFHSEMTSSTAMTTISSESGIADEESQIVSSITSVDSSMNKDSFSSEIVGQKIPSTIIAESKSDESGEVSPDEPPQVEDLTEVDNSGQIGYYDAFKNFIGGLMATRTEDGQTDNSQVSSDNSAKNESSTSDIVSSLTSSNTEAAGVHSSISTFEQNQIVSSQLITNDNSDNHELIESKLTNSSDIEIIYPTTTVVSTQSTANGNEEVKVIATKYASDGPTFLELSDSGLHSESILSTSEVISTKITSTTFHSCQSEIVSSQIIVNNSSKEEISSISITGDTFTSSVDVNASTPSNGLFHTDNENEQIVSVTKTGPIIVDVTDLKVNNEVDSKATDDISAYTVSEPSN